MSTLPARRRHPDPGVPLTPSQAISEARLALRKRRKSQASQLLRGIAWDLDRLSQEETRRYADACAEIGLLVEEVEARNRLVSRNGNDQASWARLAKLHGRLGDRAAARRCHAHARSSPRNSRAGSSQSRSRSRSRSRPRGRWTRRFRRLGGVAVLLGLVIVFAQCVG